MTTLFDRLFGDQRSGLGDIAVHSLHAALVDYAAGQTTRAEMVAYWALDAEAEAQLDLLLSAMDAQTTVVDKVRFATEFHAVALMAEEGAKYTTPAAFATRLGLT